jgi:hypothetical protein
MPAAVSLWCGVQQVALMAIERRNRTGRMPEMSETGERRLNRELRELIVEASVSLARLDADRLDELALACQMLNRDAATFTTEGRAKLARQACEAVGEMAVFERVLEATRANLDVFRRLRELREGKLEYRGGTGVVARGGGH